MSEMAEGRSLVLTKSIQGLTLTFLLQDMEQALGVRLLGADQQLLLLATSLGFGAKTHLVMT